ncbi:TonB-dependent receptor domain-containing protein [Candidatus Latescibacterota bacterium]
MRLALIVTIAATICFIAPDGYIDVIAGEVVHSVKGTVVLDDGIQVTNALVKLHPGGYADTTDVYGRFEFTSVPAGNYVVHVSAPSAGFENVNHSISVPLRKDEPLRLVVKTPTYRIDEIVVLSAREDTGKKAEQLPSFVTVVERSDFENNATTVADVIMATPGANISVMGGLGDYAEVSLRGSYSNQVHVYLDGMLLNEAIGGPVNLGTIPLTQVERVEVWRSGAPAQFGGDASGGVINIKTRDIHTGYKTFSLGYGSFNTLTASSVISIPRGFSRFNATIDYSLSNNNFEYRSDNGTMYNKDDDYWAERQNDEFSSMNILSRYSYLCKNGMHLEISDHILSHKKNLPGQDHLRQSYASFESVKNLFQIKATLNPLFHDYLEAQPAFYHIFNHERYKDPHGTVGWGIQDNTYNTDIINFLVPFTVHFRDFITGNVTPSAKHEYFRPENRLQRTIPLSCDREQFGLSGDVVFKTPTERLTVTSNIRRDRYFSSYNGAPSGLNKKPPKPRFNHITAAQCGMKVKVFKNLFIQGNYGDIMRVPSLYELFGDRGGTVSNPDLKPEHIHRWDAGIRYGLNMTGIPLNATFECAYFENNYRNLIQWYATDAGFLHPDNVGGAYVKGAEFAWNSTLFGRFTCSGNWTFQTSEVTREKRKYYRNKQLPNRPKNYGNAKVEYQFKNVVLFWTLDRKSSYYLDRANQSHKLYPGRSLYNTGISISLFSEKTKCTALVKNISDVHTFDIQGMPTPGRSFMLTVDYIVE